MTTTYYKAVRLDGTDFHAGKVQWAPPEGHDGPWIVQHPTAKRIRWERGVTAAAYLSVATVPTDCTGMRWPCRLLEVVPAGRSRVSEPGGPYPNKRVGLRFAVVRELDAHLALGPQGVHVAALIAAARSATRDAARSATWDAARDATRALVVRDLIDPAHYDTLTRPWRTHVGRIHPDDADLRVTA